MKRFYGFSKKSLETIEDVYLADGAAVTCPLLKWGCAKPRSQLWISSSWLLCCCLKQANKQIILLSSHPGPLPTLQTTRKAGRGLKSWLKTRTTVRNQTEAARLGSLLPPPSLSLFPKVRAVASSRGPSAMLCLSPKPWMQSHQLSSAAFKRISQIIIQKSSVAHFYSRMHKHRNI